MDTSQSPEGELALPSMGRHDPYAALRFRDFRFLASSTFLAVIAEQMLGVALGWELYERTGSPLPLGIIGLVQVVPVLLLALPAGHLADRFDRRWITAGSLLLMVLGALALVQLSLSRGALELIYLSVLVIGIGRAFVSPAQGALSAEVVPAAHYTNAATWSSGLWQVAAVIGPALGGLLIAQLGSAALIYGLNAAMLLVVALLTLLLRARPVAPSDEPVTLGSLLAGLRFVWDTKIVLASITLDMFAVLLGGATALLPVFAKDILQVGAVGLGWMRAAPSIGAVLAALAMAHLPPFKRAGYTLLVVVAGFGLATVVFGLSRSFALSLLMLALLGALDNISVVIRSTLLLIRTPDLMRGRVNAVHYVFIGISNELGAFESGLAAALLGTVGAVVAGGIGTILVVLGVALVWPEVRRLGSLTEEPEAAPRPLQLKPE
jgi:MFS family permease